MRQRCGKPLPRCGLRSGNSLLGCCLGLNACLVHLHKCARSPRHGIYWKDKLECTAAHPHHYKPHAAPCMAYRRSNSQPRASKSRQAQCSHVTYEQNIPERACYTLCAYSLSPLESAAWLLPLPQQSPQCMQAKAPRLLVELHAHMRQRCGKALLKSCLRRSVRLGACLAHLGTPPPVSNVRSP